MMIAFGIFWLLMSLAFPLLGWVFAIALFAQLMVWITHD